MAPLQITTTNQGGVLGLISIARECPFFGNVQGFYTKQI